MPHKNFTSMCHYFTKLNSAPLLEEEHPKKIRSIEKETLFNLLPSDVLCVISDWIYGLEHCVTFNNIVTQIHRPRNPLLRIATCEHKKYLPDFRKSALYNTIGYEWADRRDD